MPSNENPHTKRDLKRRIEAVFAAGLISQASSYE
jgi:hypothetical protein